MKDLKAFEVQLRAAVAGAMNDIDTGEPWSSPDEYALETRQWCREALGELQRGGLAGFVTVPFALTGIRRAAKCSPTSDQTNYWLAQAERLGAWWAANGA
jgi:hypothetical protein